MKAKFITFVRGLKNGTPPRFQSYLKSLILFLVVLMSVNLMAGNVTFEVGTDDTSEAKDGVSISMSVTENTSDKYYQVYSGSNMVVTSTSGNITKIVVTCTAQNTSNYGPSKFNTPNVGSYSYSGYDGTWEGNASSITFGTSAQVRMKKIVVTTESGSQIRITASSISSFISSYAEYTWTADDVSGKCWAYRGGSSGDYNIQFNKTSYVYNTDAIPGLIKSIKMTKVDGSTRSWSVYGASSALTKDNYKTSGTQIGSAQEVSSTTGTTWNVSNDKNYTYFYITKSDGGTNIGEIVITYEAAPAATPTINKTADLSNFTYEEGHGPSAEQSFKVSGSNLTASITVTAPTNFEVSKSSGSGYAGSVTLTQSSGSVAETTIYVRMKSGISQGNNPSGNITLSSTGATSQTIAVTGSVTAQAVHHTVTWYVNNVAYTTGNPTVDVVSGQKVTTLPTDPYSPDVSSKTFMGWTSTPIDTKQANPPSILFKDAENAPTVNDDVSYYAVFAKEGEGAESAIVNFTGGVKNTLTNLNYVSATGLGSDYAASNAPYRVKLDDTGDNILLSLPSVPSSITIDAKMFGESASSIEIQECASSNGDFVTVETMSIPTPQNTVTNFTSSATFTKKFIKLYFIKGGNVGLGKLVVNAKGVSYSDYVTTCDASKLLDHIAISGNAEKRNYYVGDVFDPAGLTVKAYYSDETDDDITNEVEWVYNPATLAATTTQCEVTANYYGKSATKTISELSVVQLQSITITDANVTGFTTSYADYEWTVDNISGHLYAYKSNGMQFNTGQAGYYIYNVDKIPGYIRRVTMTTHSGGTEREWTLYGGNVSMTSSSQGTSLGRRSISKQGSTWNITEGDYTFFYLEDFNGNSNISSVVIQYETVASKVTVGSCSNGSLEVTGAADLNKVAAGTKLTITPTPSSEAYRLKAVKVTKTGATPEVDVTDEVYSDGVITMPFYSITVSAEFEANNYIVTFHKNATPAEDDYTQTYTYSVAANLPAIQFTTPTGYTFSKWAETADGEGKYTDGESYTLPTEANADLYAKWLAKSIEIILDGVDDNASDGAALAEYDGGAEIITNAAWDKHELNGYYTSASSGSLVLSADGTLSANVEGFTDANAKWIKDTDEPVTLYAQWTSLENYNITYDLTGCTADDGNVTEIGLDEEYITLNFNLDAEHYTWDDALVSVYMGGNELPSDDYDFENGELSIMPTDGFKGNIEVIIMCDYAPATLTLSAIEHEYQFGENLKVNDEITLPSTVNYQASGKTFVGWSSETILTEGSMPTKNYWAKGANYTIQSATDKLYAVYATENKGAESWVIATGIDVLHAGDKVAFMSTKDDKNYASAGRSYTNEFLNCFLDPVEITLDNNVVASGADKIVPITLGGNATDGWTMYMEDYGYIVGSYALDKDAKPSKNSMRFSNTPKVLQDILINTYTYDATIKVSGDSVIMYNSGSPRFSIYKSGQTAIKLLKQNVEPSTFEKYTTSGSIHVDAPTFDNDTKPGTFTDAEHLVIINVPTSATVHYTLDGTEPTEDSATYDENEGITLTATATIKAKAFIEGVASEMLEGTFTIHNYNTVAALINGAEHNKAAVLNLNDVYVLGVYTTAKQIFVQEGTKGAIITLSDAVPEDIKAGVKLTATVSGTYIFTAHNRPQMNGCTLSNKSVSGENQRPTSIPVLGTIDATTAADNLLTLVQINNVYSVSKSYNDIVMNSASDETGTSYNVNNLLSAVKNTLPDKELACNVIGIFYKKISNSVEEYSIVPVLESDFALVGETPDAELPGVDFVGGTQAAPIEVAVDKKITITKPSTGFSGSYSFNGEEAVSMTASSYQVQITNTDAAESLTLTSTRPYYNDNSVTYYYKANPALNEYAITYPPMQTYVGITGVASAIPGTDVVMTGKRKVEHYYPGEVTVTKTDDETVKIDVTRTEVSATEATYSFEMPAYPVTVKIGFTKDPTYSIDYQTGGKITTGGTKPTEDAKYEGEEVTLKPNTWTVNNFTFDKWKVVYETGDAEPKEQHEVEVTDGKFRMPPHDVKIIAQWIPTYTVTYDKGAATSATGSVTEEPQKEGAVIKLKENAFKATGYSFTGWKASTNELIYQPGADFTMPAQAVTFTAQWDVAEYKKDGTWELVTSADQLEIGKFYVIGNSQYGKTMTSTSAGTTNKRLTAVETVFSDDKVVGEKSIIKKSDLPEETVIFQLGKESEAWTFMNVATEQYYHTGDHSNPEWLTTENKALWSLNYNSTTLTMKAIHGSYTSDSTLQYYHDANASSCGFRPYTSSQKAIRLYRFYPTACKVYFSANAGEDAVTNMPDWQRANSSTNEVTIPNDKPKRTGYTFTKWNSAQSGTGTHSAQPNETITLWQAECTLYAIWAKNTPLLTIADVEHGTIQAKPYSMDVINEGGSANVEYQKTIVISHTDNDEEYAFKTWKIYKTDDESVVIEPVVGQTSTTFDMPDYPVTVSAIYESKTSIEYTLTYDANGGEGTMTGNPFTQHWNDYITVSDNKDGDNDIFTKTLCEFNGWNTKEDGTGASYAAGSHFYMKSDVTLYAQWKGSGATYRLDKNYDGNIYVNIGAAPQGSTATCVNTNESAQIDQATTGNSITITLTGYAGKVIKNITADIKANGSESGKLNISIGDKNVFDKTYVDLEADNISTYQTRKFGDYGFKPIIVGLEENIVIEVTSPSNKSAYIQNITIEYCEPEILRDELTVDHYTTICLPKTIPAKAYTGATFWNIENKTTMTDGRLSSITIVQHEGDLEAGVPYIMYNTATEFKCYQTGEAIDAPSAEGNNGLVGVFEDTPFSNFDGDAATVDAAAAERGYYVISNGILYLCGNNCGVYANYAYIVNGYITDQSANTPPTAPRRTIGNPNGTPTTLNGLFGNQAGKAQKALIDGHIYIFRNNKMYNAQGLFVK